MLPVPLAPPDNVGEDANVVPGLGVGKYGNDEGPLVRYVPFESMNNLIFPLIGDGGVSSKNGSPESTKSRKYTEILKHKCTRNIRLLRA